MISHGLWLLLRFPDQMAKLRADPSRIKDFIEEALRFDTAVPSLARYVTRDTELNGVQIPAGAIVMTRYAAANRDPAKFPCPHMFDIDRKDKAHLFWVAGIERNCQRGSTGLRHYGCCRVRPFRIDIPDDDGRALGREPAHRGKPDAAGAACDQRRLACKPHMRSLP